MDEAGHPQSLTKGSEDDSPANMTSGSDSRPRQDGTEAAQPTAEPTAQQHTGTKEGEAPTATSQKAAHLDQLSEIKDASDDTIDTKAEPKSSQPNDLSADEKAADAQAQAPQQEAASSVSNKIGEQGSKDEAQLETSGNPDDPKASSAKNEQASEEFKDPAPSESPLQAALAAIEKVHKELEARLAESSDDTLKDSLKSALDGVATAMAKVKEAQKANEAGEAAQVSSKATRPKLASLRAAAQVAAPSTDGPLANKQAARPQSDPLMEILRQRRAAAVANGNASALEAVVQSLGQAGSGSVRIKTSQRLPPASTPPNRASKPTSSSRNPFADWRTHCAGLDVPPHLAGMFESASHILSNARKVLEPKRELQLLQSDDFTKWNKRNIAAGSRATFYLSDAPVQRPKLPPAVAKAAVAASSSSAVNFDLAKHRSMRNASDPGKRSYLLLPINKRPMTGVSQAPVAGAGQSAPGASQMPESGQRPLPTMLRLVIDKGVTKELPVAERGRKWSTQEIREHRL